MSIHRHDLAGCTPVPLAAYLKAIGVLRLVSTQADPEARGAWCGEHFVLWTRLSREGLERFFLGDYAPTPFVSPWNKGSGLMAANDPAVGPIERSVAPRFGAFREGIAAARAVNEALAKTDAAVRAVKDEAKQLRGRAERDAMRRSDDYKQRLSAAERAFKRQKADVIPNCRRAWRGGHLGWFECAVVVTGDGKATFPSLLGTGGNDGRFDITNNAMQRIGELFDLADPRGGARPEARSALAEALWGRPGRTRDKVIIGQFLPGAAGGANSTSGPSGEPTVNRWDFLLALEGTIAFRASATRRLSAGAGALGSAPFAVFNHAAGHGTAAASDEKPRGEQWMPLWRQPATFREISALLAEGKAQVGRQTARQPIDLVRAITRLGVARGLSAFVRYGFLERQGQSNLAVALGRVGVGDHPRARLVDDLAPWLDRLHRRARDRGATARVVQGERRLADAVFAALAHPDEPGRWQAVLIAAAQVEALLVPGGSPLAGEIPRLRVGWFEATDDGSAEHRLALALGTARAQTVARGRGLDPVRGHLLPLDKRGRLAASGAGSTRRVDRDPRVLPAGSTPVQALLAIVTRRLIEAGRGASRTLPIVAAPGRGASLADVGAFIDGRLDDGRILALARAFAAVRDREAVDVAEDREAAPDDAWLAIRLAHLPGPLDRDTAIPVDPAIIRRLAAGDAASAVALALRRLRAAGIRPPLDCGTTHPDGARRWGAALAFPLRRSALRAALRQLSLHPAARS